MKISHSLGLWRKQMTTETFWMWFDFSRRMLPKMMSNPTSGKSRRLKEDDHWNVGTQFPTTMMAPKISLERETVNHETLWINDWPVKREIVNQNCLLNYKKIWVDKDSKQHLFCQHKDFLIGIFSCSFFSAFFRALCVQCIALPSPVKKNSKILYFRDYS